MLEPVDSRDAIARDPETGARLLKTRAQYTLMYGEGGETITRHWRRRTVTSDQDAIDRAKKSLAKIINKQS